MNIGFDGKVALVTGAASGIGLACAELLADSGAKVALTDIHADNLAKATKSMESKGIAHGYQLDVTDIPGISSTVSQIRNELGEIDILVCSAGVAPHLPVESIRESDWDRLLDINTKGLFFCNQEVAIQSMIPRKVGSIVNIASKDGLIGNPTPFTMTAHYNASKGGVIALTRQLAIEWAQYNVRVNAVAPGVVVTAMTQDALKDQEVVNLFLESTPLGHFLTAHDVATTVCFLASDAAKMITGVVLPVDGGWTAR